MKKLGLLVIPVILISSCDGKKTYSSLIETLKSYSGAMIVGNSYSNGYYNEEGFTLYDGEIVLYHQGDSSKSGGYVFIILPNATSAPNSYYCLYSWSSYTTSYEESASFYINNTYTDDTLITFSKYTGDSSMRQSAQNLAQSSVNLLLLRFDLWLGDVYNTSLKSVGMFPNFL